MSQSMRRFSEWIFRANGDAVTGLRLLKATPSRHKGRGAHPRVMSRRVGRKPGLTVLIARVPDDLGYLLYEVVTSDPAQTAAKIEAGAWL